MPEIFRKIVSLLTYLDLYGRNIELYVNSYTKVRSKFGASISLIILILSLYLFLDTFKGWMENRNLQIVSSSHSYTVAELLSKKGPISFTFDSSNYNIYVVFQAQLSNGTKINYETLQKYFTQSFIYWAPNGTEKRLKSNQCTAKKQKEFLMYENEGQIFNNTFCIDEKFEMGLFPDHSKSRINRTSLGYLIEKCKNSTANGNFCVTNEEIYAMLPYITIQLSIPKSIYDFNDPESPRKRAYDYNLYYLDPYLFKSYIYNIMPVYLETDVGSISDDMRLNSVDFNVEAVNPEIQSNFQENRIRFLSHEFIFGINELIYYRKNEKIYQIVGNFGGLINILFLLGHITCFYYNLLVLKYKLINMSFENLEKTAKTTYDDEFPVKREEKNFKFSIFSILCPKLSKQKIYEEALNNLYEYMDINNIINRLQDVDKLKLILLDDNQREVFDHLPKPGVGEKTLQKNLLTMENIVRTKKTKYRRKSKKKYAFLFNGDPINKRIFQMMDPKIQFELKQLQEVPRVSIGSPIQESENQASALFAGMGILSGTRLLSKNNYEINEKMLKEEEKSISIEKKKSPHHYKHRKTIAFSSKIKEESEDDDDPIPLFIPLPRLKSSEL